jgi:ferredoxin-NADP reductase
LERLSAGQAPIKWSLAKVRSTVQETHQAKSISFDVPGWPGHIAGQHVDVRLTAEDGYSTERSYSIASAPEDAALELTVERLEDGEVSPYLTDELRDGDEIELRGPIGGYFNWSVDDGGPLLLVAGGSGLVPLMSMLRHRAAQNSAVDTRLLVSTRRLEDLLYREELERLEGGDGLTIQRTLTREAPPDWKGWRGRIDHDKLEAVAPAPDENPKIYVCGPTAFAETAADLLVGLGNPPTSVRIERFGPTGG